MFPKKLLLCTVSKSTLLLKASHRDPRHKSGVDEPVDDDFGELGRVVGRHLDGVRLGDVQLFRVEKCLPRPEDELGLDHVSVLGEDVDGAGETVPVLIDVQAAKVLVALGGVAHACDERETHLRR